MTQVAIGDRLDKTLKEYLLPEFVENYYLLSSHPLARYLGMEKEEAKRGSGSAKQPRVERSPEGGFQKIGNSAYQFQIVHNHTPFGGGTYAQAIGANLRAGKFEGDRSQNIAKFITQAMDIPAQVMDASNSPEKSIVNELVQNMMGALHSMQWETNRMMVAPKTHALCVIDDAVNNSTSFQVQTNESETNETPATQHLQKHDVLLVGTANQIEAGTAKTVEVSEVTGDITFTSKNAETVSNNDLVVRADVYDVDNSRYNDITSIASLISNTGTVQNLNKANYKWFQSTQTAVGGALTEAAMKTLANTTRRFSKNPGARFIMCNFTQWERYSATLTTVKTYDADKFAGNLAGGVQGLDFYTPDGSLPVFIDDMVEDGVMYLIDPNAFKWFNFRDFGPADDSLMMQGYAGQRKTGTLDYEFALWQGGELAQTNAQACGKLTGITS